MKDTSATSAAIIIGSLLISVSILISSGSIKLANITFSSPKSAISSSLPQGSTGVKTNITVSLGKLPVKGSKDAKIAVVEFADFRCPFCKSFFDETEPQLLKDYVNTGKVKFSFRHFAFLGPASITAANASECANEQNKFWDFYDYLYKSQPDESDTSMFTTEKLTNIAGTLGLETTKFSSCLSTNKYNQNISLDQSEAQTAGVSGTPSFIIGKIGSDGKVSGELLVGAQPYNIFKSSIDRLLK